MGLTIHYSGRLKNAFELKAMIAEVRDIAIEKGWDIFVFEQQFKNNSFSNPPEIEDLFGIMVTPKDAEPLCFSFLSDGRMCGIINFNVIQINHIIDEDLAFNLFTKTQYAGFEIHKQLIILLDYISKKYLADFKCSDEGQYWETRDEELLIETFKRFDSFMDSFASSLEMMPPNEGENAKDFILRLANSTNQRVIETEENVPQLSLEDENEFKRMKIKLEHGGFFGEINAAIPPEIEGMFLDHVMAFENQFKDAKRISVFERIGKPSWIKSQELSPAKLEQELERLYTLLENNGILLNVLYDYENENLLIYDFITLELFNEEIDDISIKGMRTNFIYEDFHPNHKEDLKNDSVDFWTNYFENNNERFDEFTLGDLLNSEEMIDFRYSFLTFRGIKVKIKEVNFSVKEQKATTKVQLNFEALIDKQNKIIFNCESVMHFYYQSEFWYLQEVGLPKK